MGESKDGEDVTQGWSGIREGRETGQSNLERRNAHADGGAGKQGVGTAEEATKEEHKEPDVQACQGASAEGRGVRRAEAGHKIKSVSQEGRALTYYRWFPT